jgi:hypothetical protein
LQAAFEVPAPSYQAAPEPQPHAAPAPGQIPLL